MRIQLDNIICATDFSDYANQTIPCGIALARVYGAKLCICHVVDMPTASTFAGDIELFSAEHQEKMVNDAQTQMEKLTHQLPIQCESWIAKGNAAEEISRLAEAKNADLVIVAAHGLSGLKRLLLGSVTERLMRALSRPLLVLRTHDEEVWSSAGADRVFERILVGCDFSADSDRAFQYALSLSEEFQADLHMAHVIEPPEYKNVFVSAVARVERRHFLRSRLTQRLHDMVPEEALDWCMPHTILLEGQPEEELVGYAVSHDIDLIVLGVRGYSLMESLLVGSTTDRVVRRAPCAVLSVCR